MPKSKWCNWEGGSIIHPHLPEEILMDIFSRLPAKGVGKCRCLSKKWRTDLSTSRFIDTHLNRKVHQQENHLLLISISAFPVLCDMPSPTTNIIPASKNLELEYKTDELCGTCKGLVLLCNARKEMYLVNPITQQHLRIPNPPLRRSDRRIVCDLGYDILSEDYKIVGLTFTWDSGNRAITDTVIDLYSVKMGNWKTCGSSPYDHTPFLLWEHGALINGIVHWVVYIKESDYTPLIASFDLADEVFRDIPVPPAANCFPRRTFVVRGSFCILEEPRAVMEVTNLWMMKDYGVVESWTKIASWQSERLSFGVRKPLALIGNDEEAEELLAIDSSSYLVMRELKKKSFRVMFVDRNQFFSDGCTFVDSLVSPIQAAIAD